MINFITSESGTVTRRAGLSSAWVAVALVAVTVLTALPAQAENNCVPYQQCHGAFCGGCAWYGCQVSGDCVPYWKSEQYCNDQTYGCMDMGWGCISCTP